MSSEQKTAYVFCPGPGGVHTVRWAKEQPFPRYPGAHVKIGVNRAPIMLRDEFGIGVHFWCSGNREFFKDGPVPKEGYCTWDSAREVGFEPIVAWDELRWPDDPGMGHFSTIAALLLAGKLGADRIEVHGMDWAGNADWDGHTEHTRQRERWIEERRLVQVCARQLPPITRIFWDVNRVLTEELRPLE